MSGSGLQAISLDDGRVVLKLGVRELVVSGEDAQRTVALIVDALQTGSGVADLLTSLADGQRADAVDVLQTLVARQMLDDLPPGSEDRFYAEFGPAGTSAPGRLGSAHAVVHGRGLVADALRSALEGLGIGIVSAVDRPGLRSAWAGAPAPALDGPPPEEPDIVVAVSDCGQEEALLAVARETLVTSTPFLPVWVSELVGFVGPLTWPLETACLHCYQLRVDANVADPAVSRARRRQGTATGLLAPMASIVAQIAAMEVAKALGGFAPADVAGRSIEINLVSYRSAVRRVLKLPRCPDCGPAARRPSQTVLAGVQITE